MILSLQACCREKNRLKMLPKNLGTPRKKATVWPRSGASMASSSIMPVVDLKIYYEQFCWCQIDYTFFPFST